MIQLGRLIDAERELASLAKDAMTPGMGQWAAQELAKVRRATTK
jgi:hypothetical protein